MVAAANGHDDVVSVLTGQYEDPEGQAIYYRIPLGAFALVAGDLQANRDIFPTMSGRRNLQLLGRLHGVGPRVEEPAVIRVLASGAVDGEIDVSYMRNGGVLQTVLRRLASA